MVAELHPENNGSVETHFMILLLTVVNSNHIKSSAFEVFLGFDYVSSYVPLNGPWL